MRPCKRRVLLPDPTCQTKRILSSMLESSRLTAPRLPPRRPPVRAAATPEHASIALRSNGCARTRRDAGVDGETPPTVDLTGDDPVRLVDAAALATKRGGGRAERQTSRRQIRQRNVEPLWSPVVAAAIRTAGPRPRVTRRPTPLEP